LCSSPLASHCSGVKRLWSAPSFPAALRALIVHPAPALAFPGKLKKVVSRAREKESHKFPRGRNSLFLALRRSQAGEMLTAVVTAVGSACSVLPARAHCLSSQLQWAHLNYQSSGRVISRCFSMNSVALLAARGILEAKRSPLPSSSGDHCTPRSSCHRAPLVCTLLHSYTIQGHIF